MSYQHPTTEVPGRWSAKASTRRRVDTCDGPLTVVGSGLPACDTAVQLVMGPASLSLREEDAIALARALMQAVHDRREAFCRMAASSPT